jgi:hypothetical protein
MFALTFGFVSLAHGPVMAFGKSMAVPTASHAHHAAAPVTPTEHHDGSVPSGADNGTSCAYAFGCFVSVTPLTIEPPAVDFRPFATLWPAPPEMMFASRPEPADPPPRLQS